MNTFGVDLWELLVVGLIVLLLFGNRLPELFRQLGEGLSEFLDAFPKSVEDIEDLWRVMVFLAGIFLLVIVLIYFFR